MGDPCRECTKYSESLKCTTGDISPELEEDLSLRRIPCSEGLRRLGIIALDTQISSDKSSLCSLKIGRRVRNIVLIKTRTHT
jgi:hypothetical protein